MDLPLLFFLVLASRNGFQKLTNYRLDIKFQTIHYNRSVLAGVLNWVTHHNMLDCSTLLNPEWTVQQSWGRQGSARTSSEGHWYTVQEQTCLVHGVKMSLLTHWSGLGSRGSGAWSFTLGDYTKNWASISLLKPKGAQWLSGLFSLTERWKRGGSAPVMHPSEKTWTGTLIKGPKSEGNRYGRYLSRPEEKSFLRAP